MPTGNVGPQGVTVLNRPAIASLTKVIKVNTTDSTAFVAFSLPKFAVIAGVYVMGTADSTDTGTATITVGVGAGTEILNAYDVKGSGQGYHVAGDAAGSYVGTQLSADTQFKAVYTGQNGDSAAASWLVKVEYYIPSVGQTY